MKQNLIIIMKSFPKLSETFILQELKHMIDQGFSPVIYAYRSQEEIIHSDVLMVSPYVRYLSFSAKNIRKNLLSLLLFAYRKCNRKAVKNVFLQSMKTFKADEDHIMFMCFYAALWIIRDMRLDEASDKFHIHTQFLDFPTLVANNIKAFVGTDYSISCHAKDIYLTDNDTCMKFINDAKLLKTCTKFNVDHLAKTVGSAEKLRLIYHGIDTKFFSKEHSNKPLRLLSVARLVEKKGYIYILKALDILRVNYPNFRYTIIGHGKLESQISEYINYLGLKSYVNIITYASKQTIKDYLEHTDIFLNGSVVTAKGDRDGIPNSLLEAMAMEVPVVATDVSGISEVITHKQTGYLCESRDAMDIYNGILYYIENPAERTRIAENARKFVEDKFDSVKLFEKCADFYQEVIENER